MEEGNTIKLNHDCKYCGKGIYINQDPITGDRGPCHLDCLLWHREEQWRETCEIMSNPEIMKGLKSAMEDYRNGDFTTVTQPNKIKVISKCSECKKVGPVGVETGNCLECLDWKMEDLSH